jgi:hypothetical protein
MLNLSHNAACPWSYGAPRTNENNMKSIPKDLLAAALVAAVAFSASISGVLADPVDDSFGYDLELMQSLSPPVGTIIDASNVEQYAEIIDVNIVDLIKQDLFTITVGEPFSIDPHPVYVEATRQHAANTALGDAPGILLNYNAGRPFVFEPSADDPRAGEKIAWNFRYTYATDGGELPHMYWQYRNMKKDNIERELSFYASNLRFMHRHTQDPKPEILVNPAKIYQALYLRVLAPPDVRSTQVLVHRLEDDLEIEQTWMYVGTHRRVRRLASGQTTDAFLGSDVMIEDFLGYNGRISVMDWSYHGTVNVLLPFYRYDEQEVSERKGRDGYRFVGFHGKGHCFPKVTWSMRKAHILEARPHWDRHPLSVRRYYADTQSYFLAYGNFYDKSEKLWKIAYPTFSHPDHHTLENKGAGQPIIDAVTTIDLQAQHCTTLQMQSLSNKTTLKPTDFTVQALRKLGR